MGYGDMVSIKCPFFRRAEKSRIVCEGAFPGSSCTTWLESRQERDKVLTRYCKRDYCQCPLYRAAAEKW